MSGDEVKFEEQLAALGGYVPAEEAARKALEAARQAVLEARVARQKKRRLWMKLTIPSGIAAALIGAAVLMTVIPGTSTANAAEQLQQAVEATKAYKGWSHWTQELDGTPATQTVSGVPLPKRTTLHFSEAAGIAARVDENDDNLTVEMDFIQKRESASYDRKSGVLTLSTMDQDRAKMMQAMRAPVTMTDFLAEFAQQGGHKPASVKEVPEGDQTRFDIVLFATEDEYKAAAAEHGGLPRKMTVWVNKEGLITRIQLEGVQTPLKELGSMGVRVTYGPPEPKDIYDLGVPRNAKLVDKRMDQKSLAALTDEAALAGLLDEKRLKGFGDGVALLTHYITNIATRQVEMRAGNATLYVVQGDKTLANQYLLFAERASGQDRPMFKSAPAGWPAPDAAALLPAFRNALPQVYCITNGNQGWYGSQNISMARGIVNGRAGATAPSTVQELLSLRPLDLGKDSDRELVAVQTLGSQIWPRKQQSGLTIGTTEMKNQGKLIRVRYRMNGMLPDGKTSGPVETTYMLDPSRDYLPTEWYRTSVKSDTGEVVERLATHYVKYAQLPNQQWYPTDWTQEHQYRMADTGEDWTMLEVSHLQILPGMKVDDTWFEMPAGAAVQSK